jgi:hypothetical protein
MRTNNGLIKRALAAVAVAAVATGTIATFATEASGRDRDQAPTVSASSGQTPTTPSTTTPLPAPQVHRVNAPDAPETAPAVRVVQQQVSVAVIGGDMTIAPESERLTLTRVGGSDRYTATLPTVRVVDARGTLAGWTARVAPIDLPDAATLRLDPGKPVAIYGNQSEIERARPSNATTSAAATLMSAAPEGGGGTFEVNGVLTVTVPHAQAPQMTLNVALTVA